MGRPDITLSAAAGPQTISDDDSAIFSLSLFYFGASHCCRGAAAL